MTTYTYTGHLNSVSLRGQVFERHAPVLVTDAEVIAAIRQYEPAGDFNASEDAPRKATASAQPAPKAKQAQTPQPAPEARAFDPQPTAEVQSQPEPRDRLHMPNPQSGPSAQQR